MVKKFRFYLVGIDLKQEYKLYFKEIILEEIIGGKVMVIVQVIDDESNDKEGGQKERRFSDRLGIYGGGGKFDLQVNNFSDQINEVVINQERV